MTHAVAPEAQTALTLREVCGLTTEDIARAFLVSPPTLAQRIVRAKAKIRDARIPYRMPPTEELPHRLEDVLRVAYLVFNEGDYASASDSLTRPDLSAEAIRLGRLLVALLPEAEPVPEAVGLLALMLLQDSRRTARTSPEGELIPLEEQNRALWDRQQIAEGTALVRRALSSGRFGPYTIQAAIGAVHAQAPSVAATDWSQIVGLYDLLMRVVPSPAIELNRAVAVAMRDGPEAGLVLVDALMGLVLPEPTKTPPGLVLPFSWVRVRGSRAYVSGHGPLNPDSSIADPLGKVGAEVSEEQGYEAARLTALAMLTSLKRELGDLDRVSAWLRVFGMVNSAPDFSRQPNVINGFSDLILELYGQEAGDHARSAVGMAGLPLGMPAEIEAEVEILGG